MSFEKQLVSTSTIQISQRRELVELLGYETRNKYALSVNGQPFGFAAEQQKGFLGFLFRQLLGHWRSFEIHIFDQSRVLVAVAQHPFRWFFKRLEISRPGGEKIGAIQQRWSVFSKRFDVENARGMPVLTVSSPIYRLWTFKFERQGREVATVSKKWTGMLKEVFTDTDNFELHISSPDVTPEERLLLLSAAIFIDIKYFEKKAGD